MRTLLGYGGWVLPAVHVSPSLARALDAPFVALPPSDALCLRVGSDGERRVNFFTERALFELWAQSAVATTRGSPAFIPEYSAGLRAFDAVARRRDIVGCIAIDGDVLMYGAALDGTLSTALRRMRVERAAAVLSATASGASDAALRYRTKTLAAFVEHDAFFVASSGNSGDALRAFSDEHLLRDVVAMLRGSDTMRLEHRMCTGAALAAQCREHNVSLLLNPNTPVSCWFAGFLCVVLRV